MGRVYRPAFTVQSRLSSGFGSTSLSLQHIQILFRTIFFLTAGQMIDDDDNTIQWKSPFLWRGYITGNLWCFCPPQVQ